MKYRIKALSIVMAALMTIGVMSGCNNTDGNSESTPSAETSSKADTSNSEGTNRETTSSETTTSDTAIVPPEGYEISILTISFEGEIISDDHPNVLALEEHTGYDIRLEYVLNASYNEQMNTRLASGNMPGLVVLTSNTATIVSAAKSGAFWDITDEYSKFEYLSQMDEGTLNNISIEGRIYGMPRTRTVGRNGISYRSDWLENLGMQEPTTLEELYEVLYAFAYNDPDGNGADDTYGMTWCKYMGPFNNIAVMHGAPNYWGVDDSDTIYPWFESDAYVEALDYCKKLYDEKLINQDFAALETSDWANDFGIGKSGVWIDTADQANRHATNLKTNGLITQEQVDDGSVVWVMGSVANADGDRYALPTSGHAGYVAITTSGAPTEEDRDYYLDFMDKCNDEIGQNLLNYGTEGVIYYFDEEGYLVSYTAEEVQALPDYQTGWGVTDGWNQFMMSGGGVPNLLYDKKLNPRQARQNEVFLEQLEIAVHNPTLALNSDTYTAKQSTLELIISDATINYIMGKIDLDGFQSEVGRWYEEGGQASLEEYQAAYDEIN